MTGDLTVWQLLLLAAVYLADAVVLVGLCRDELRDRGGAGGRAEPSARAKSNCSSAVIAG